MQAETMTAEQAIGESKAANRIVTIHGIPGIIDALTAECDDSTGQPVDEGAYLHEFWGVSEDGHWRVHVLVEAGAST